MSKVNLDISVVVPVYNEENSIVPFLGRIIPILEKISLNYEIIFVLDPSTDKTREVVIEQSLINSDIKMIIIHICY